MFQNLMQYMDYGPVSACKTVPVCSCILWVLILSLTDTVLEAAECMVV